MGASQSVAINRECDDPSVPMWVLKLSDFLQLIDWPSHEELLRTRKLVRRQTGFICIFVSHQWLGDRHPDPKNQQLPVLQKAFRSILNGIPVATDVASQFFGDRKVLTKADRARIQEAYIWLDWFCVPQILEEVEELSMDDSMTWTKEQREDFSGKLSLPLSPAFTATFSRASSSGMTTQDIYISSIPLFVEACEIFVVLVPAAYHTTTQQRANFSSWLSRGWCRCEMWCNVLSDTDIPVVVIKGEEEVELGTPFPVMDRPPHEGEFTVEEDRMVIQKIVERALGKKLHTLWQQKRWDLFRFYRARYEILLGKPEKKRTVEQFVADFEFKSLEVARKKTKGLSPLICAVISGDAPMVAHFGEGKEVNKPTRAKIEDVFVGHWPPLMFALEYGSRHLDVVEQLLELKADPNGVDGLGLPLMGACKSIEQVDLMVRYGANVNHTTGPAHFPSLSMACARCAPPEVIRRFIEFGAEVNPRSRGICSPHPISNLAPWSAMNASCREVAMMLVEAKCDVNLKHEAKGLFKAIELVSRAQLQLVGSKSALVHFYSEWTTTPLGFACFFGAEQLVEFLLEHDADPEITNVRGHKPFELARGESVKRVIQEFKSTISI